MPATNPASYAYETTTPVFAPVSSLPNPLHRDPGLLTYAFSHAFASLALPQTTLALRALVPDAQTLDRVGDPAALGLTPANDPLSDVQVPLLDPATFQTILTALKAGRTPSLAGVGTETRSFYMFGNPNLEDKIQRYWSILVQRLEMGDGVSHAHYIAKLDGKNFESVNFPEFYYMWQFYTPNQLTGGVLTDGDPRITDAGDPAFVALLKPALALLTYQFYEKLFPDLLPLEPAHGDDRVVLGIMQAESGTPASAGNTSTGGGLSQQTVTYAGIGLAALGALLLLGKKK